MRMEALGEHKLTVESCDNREREQLVRVLGVRALALRRQRARALLRYRGKSGGQKEKIAYTTSSVSTSGRRAAGPSIS